MSCKDECHDMFLTIGDEKILQEL